ncbi:hypothetical protein DXX93_08085 [Thalassotalea euphylliae]|uniref:Uncharacterized protein n=1 Tax=Thalassotalea euphylliae TaxID=1655234 RepID=A0A3E0TRC1_9GAMM|nr:hypothetical protein [Thalassotalea euphylliae]REL26542.1 hypothetical protein DXX93_08085 [Thalassotalea euphylliae]
MRNVLAILNKRLVIFSALFIAGLILAYQAYFFLQPSVTLVNKSHYLIEKASVTLPNSHLNFGDIAPNNINTIYYALAQQDGEYHYRIELGESVNTEVSGACGYVTHSEYHKRVDIVFTADLAVQCYFR